VAIDGVDAARILKMAGCDGKLYVVYQDEPQLVHVFNTSSIRDQERQAVAPPEQVQMAAEDTLAANNPVYWIGVS
jgi:hypothetical protein